MPAESNPPRRLRRLLSLLAPAALAAALAGAGAIVPFGGPAGPWRAVAADEEGVRVSVAPVVAPQAAAGDPLEVEVELVNGSDAPVPAGELRLGVARTGIDDAAGLDAWLSGAAGSRVVQQQPSATLSVGAATTYRITLPDDATDAGDPVIGLSASLTIDGAEISSDRTAVANTRVERSSQPALALAYPLSVPASSDGLVPADDLESWTGPTGLLTRQLEAVTGLPVAVAVDPRILASIRVLGASAPESAVEWLDALDRMPNEVFPLTYADADLAGQAQAGLEAPLEPLGLSDVIDASDFWGEVTLGGVTTGAGETPSDDDLVAWAFTRTDIAWPADDTVASGDLDRIAANGLTTSILAPGNVEPADATSNAASTIDGRAAVVADSRVQDALRAAAAAETEVGWRGETARLLAELAVSPADGSSVMLATFARSAGADADRVGATLRELDGSDWSRGATLAEAIGAPPQARTLASMPEDPQRIRDIGRLLAAEQSVDAFSDVLSDPSLLSNPARRQLLALLGVGWLEPEASSDWSQAVGRWLIDQRALTDAVRVVPSSSVLVVASETGIPVTVENDLPYAVDVVLTVDPSNGRLLVQDAVEATVEGVSRQTIRVPVEAGVGSGEVDLVVSLSSPSGTPVGGTVTIPANVHADWEGVGAAVLAATAVLVFTVGIVRTVRRRRRARIATATGDARADAAPEAGPETDAAPAEDAGPQDEHARAQPAARPERQEEPTDG
ncbi:DUF6049 family protein [Agromyces sp. SYSU T0242]|uniref:DUF6049 family protein n=1 Tax=Agromyces litoreus TaxID=3158561 RepID=UPI0033932F85